MDVSRRDLIKLGSTAAAAGGLLGAQMAQVSSAGGRQPDDGARTLGQDVLS